MTKSANTLVILGNGFDLHCGLDTSYSHFMKYINNKRSSVCQYSSSGDNINYIVSYLIEFTKSISLIKEYSKEYTASNFMKHNLISPSFKMIFQPCHYCQYNFWQSYFNLLNNVKISIFEDDEIQFNNPIYLQNWCDIEGQMTYFFHQYSSFLDNYIRFYKQYYHIGSNRIIGPKQRRQGMNNIIFSFHTQVHKKFIQDDKKWANHTNAFMIPLISMLLRKCNFHPKSDNLYDFLFNQLYDFENKFEKFLKHANHDDYAIDEASHKKPTKFYQDKDKTMKQLTDSNSYNLITFNYTNDKTDGCNHCKNVHSTIFGNGHPIFGIDATNNFDKEYYRFTKTYRIMNLTNNDDSQILKLNPNTKTQKIVFYGQSLAPADYMYFEAIFNHFHIYSNIKMQLEFCYSSTINGKIDKDEKRHQFNRVYKLMNKYGAQSHHPDLLHKMLLENRLSMRDLG